MLIVPMLIAPAVMTAASHVERRLGPAAAGWLAALPVSLAISLLTVVFQAGRPDAATMALSAAVHVPAQVAFAVVFVAVLRRWGFVAGAAAGTGAYLAGCVALGYVPAAVAVVAAVPALVFAPRLMASRTPPRTGSPRGRAAGVLVGLASSAIVGGAVLTAHVAGPAVAGTVAAFPTMSTTLAAVVARRDGTPAAGHALNGLVRSLPCYLVFCLAVAFTVGAIGVAAVGVALIVGLAAGRLTWRTVPVAVPGGLAAIGR